LPRLRGLVPEAGKQSAYDPAEQDREAMDKAARGEGLDPNHPRQPEEGRCEMSATLHHAFLFLDMGLSVLPLHGNRPLFPWKHLTERRATPEEIREWFGRGDTRTPALSAGTFRGSSLWTPTSEAWSQRSRTHFHARK
jgi:hypothetical protein